MKKSMWIGGFAFALGLMLVSGLGAVTVPNNVVVNEVMWDGGDYYVAGNPNPVGEYGEYIELYNPTPNAINMTNWQIIIYKEGGGVASSFTLNNASYNKTISAYGYYLIIDDSYFVVQGGGNYKVPFDIMNNGGKVELRNNAGILVDVANNGNMWSAGENTDSGRSMERKDITKAGNSGLQAWASCHNACWYKGRNGTPGKRNSQVPVFKLNGIEAMEFEDTVLSTEYYTVTPVKTLADYGAPTINYDMEIIPAGAVPQSMYFAVNFVSPANTGEIVYSPYLEKTSLGEFSESFLLKATTASTNWFGFAFFDITNQLNSGSQEGLAAAAYILGKFCPWDWLLEQIFNPANWKTVTRDEAKRNMYDIRDRMTPAMRYKADASSPVFLYLLKNDATLKSQMIAILKRILDLNLLAKRDTVVPQDLRNQVVSVSYSAEKLLNGRKIAAPELRSLIVDVRKIAQDSTVKTVNNMLSKYGRRSGR